MYFCWSPGQGRTHEGIKKTLLVRQSSFFEKESERLHAVGRHAIAEIMLDADGPKPWSVGELEPDLTSAEIDEKLSVHFTEITNEKEALNNDQIPKSRAPQVLIPQLLERDVAERLKNYKIPNSTVPGYLPKQLVKNITQSLPYRSR